MKVSLLLVLRKWQFLWMIHLWDALPQTRRPLPAGGGGGHGGGGLHDGGRHVGHGQRRGGGGVCGRHRQRVPHQAQVPLHLDAGVVFCGQFEHLKAVVVQPWNLTLEGPTLVITTNLNGSLAVKDGQLSPYGYTDTRREKKTKEWRER